MTQEAQEILAVVDDMFFASKIRAAAEEGGLTVRFVKSTQQLEIAIGDQASSLVIIDLESNRVDPIQGIKTLKSSVLASVPIVGFLSHVHLDLKRQAEAAGCDYVLPRSAFTAKLPAILQGRLPV